MRAMDEIPYEPNAYYIFDQGYFDLERLFRINLIDSNFIIRERGKLQYKIIVGDDLLDGTDNNLIYPNVFIMLPIRPSNPPVD